MAVVKQEVNKLPTAPTATDTPVDVKQSPVPTNPCAQPDLSGWWIAKSVTFFNGIVLSNLLYINMY
jgi:hypothetical protein